MIGALRASDRPYAVWDAVLPGFGVYVARSGRKTFVAQTRIRGVSRRTTFGAYPEHDVHAMRAAARSWLYEAEKRQRPLRPKPPAPEAVTLQQLAQDYCTDQGHRWAASTLRNNAAALRRCVYPVLGHVDVARLSPANVERWFDGMGGSPGSANRAAPILSVILRYAEQKSLRPEGSNPCRRLKLYKRRPLERFLSPSELRKLGRRLAEREAGEPTFAAAIRLLLFTGMRASEVLGLRFSQVEGPRAKLLTSKTGPRTVYLCAAARRLVEDRRATATTDWVIPGRKGGLSYPALNSAWGAFRVDAELEDVRLHDLRHTYASVAAGQGIGLSLVGGLLGHALPESTMRYTHFSDDVTRAAVDRVSARLDRLSRPEEVAA